MYNALALSPVISQSPHLTCPKAITCNALKPSPVALRGEEGLPEVRLRESDAEELAAGRQNPARKGHVCRLRL